MHACECVIIRHDTVPSSESECKATADGEAQRGLQALCATLLTSRQFCDAFRGVGSLPELGKAQRRIAIDIIAYDDNYLYLCEVKDQISKIKSDKLKLEKFIKDEKFSNAAKKFTKRYRLGNKELKLCLSFAVNTSEKFFEWINNTDLENIDSICAFLTDERKHIIWNKGEYHSYSTNTIHLYEPAKF